jgi:hypothetical protein
MSIICDTSLAVSRPDASPVTCRGVLLEEALRLAELLDIDEVDISTLVIGLSGDPAYGV